MTKEKSRKQIEVASYQRAGCFFIKSNEKYLLIPRKFHQELLKIHKKIYQKKAMLKQTKRIMGILRETLKEKVVIDKKVIRIMEKEIKEELKKNG